MSKPKILILSSTGGYCHRSASAAIEEIFKDEYQCFEVFPLEQFVCFGDRTGEDLIYNMFLQNGWIRTMNFLASRLAPLWFQARRRYLESIVTEYIEREKPDLVLSLIPFVNYPASEAARKKEIPYLLVTIDSDLTVWALGLDLLKHPQFKVTIARDHELTRGILAQNRIPQECIEVTGIPIHPVFLQARDEKTIKEEFEIPFQKGVVMIIMGGAGGKSAIAYAKQLHDLALNMHVIVCTGNNVSLYNKMKELNLGNQETTFTILSFTDKIADLMQIADVIITKPGSGTVNEALVRKKPILVDNTHATLSWEKANCEFIEASGVGKVIHQIGELSLVIPSYLYDSYIQQEVLEAYEKMTSSTFAEKIKRIVPEMIEARSACV